MTAIAYGVMIGVLFAIAWALGWSFCAKHSFWKMQAAYIKQSEDAEAEKIKRIQEEFDANLRLASAPEGADPGSMPPPPPTPDEVNKFGWTRKRRA